MIDFDDRIKNRNNYTNLRIYIALGTTCLVYKIHVRFLLEMVHYTAAHCGCCWRFLILKVKQRENNRMKT